MLVAAKRYLRLFLRPTSHTRVDPREGTDDQRDPSSVCDGKTPARKRELGEYIRPSASAFVAPRGQRLVAFRVNSGTGGQMGPSPHRWVPKYSRRTPLVP